MGMLDYLKDGNNPGIIEETAFYFITPISEYGVTSLANETEAMSLFSILLGVRAQGAMLAGQRKGNLLLDTGVDKIYEYYEEGFGPQFLYGMKLDLPLFVFTAMYLENPDLRKALKEADETLRREVFNAIHTVCEYCYSYLVQYPDLMCRENLQILLSYLQKRNLI